MTTANRIMAAGGVWQVAVENLQCLGLQDQLNSDQIGRAMSDHRGERTVVKQSGVIIRPGLKGVFSELVTPNGGLVTVMSREVFAKASRAAGAEIRKASREISARAGDMTGQPSKGLR